jgi:multicomponent Na+:H+ antiporter subunit D
LWPLGILTAVVLFLGLGAEALSEYVDLAVAVLSDPRLYVDAVLSSNL